jgi:hypothetical protein
MYLNQSAGRQWCHNYMLPRIKYHLWLGIPNANLNRNRHVANWTNDNNTRRGLGTVDNILI